MDKIRILGVSGSLRLESTNTNILKAFRGLLPLDAGFHIFQGLDQIPHFSPGLDENDAVKTFKAAIQRSDAVVICTPEYAFGVPGTLKNALDWTVATGDLNEKPVSVISASPLNTGGDKALASLLLTLTALGTVKNENSSLSIANVKRKIDDHGNVKDEDTLAEIQHQCDNLLSLIASRQ